MQNINFLLSNSEVWLQYATRLNLLNESKGDLVELKKRVLEDKKIESYLRDIADFHSLSVTNHKNPDLPIHKLLFLLDLGLDKTIPEIDLAINEILKHKDKNGVYQSLTNIPEHYGGSGKNMFSWCLCDAPLLLLALVKSGIDYDIYIREGIEYLIGLHKEQGFPCSVSNELGSFRGPGRKDECCPYANLIMLQLLSEIQISKNDKIVDNIIEQILSLWENSRNRHPYMFYMGTDFRKLKAPAIWYDIISVTDCLSKFKYAREDNRFKEMIQIIKEKQDERGLFKPESVYQKFKNWDFGQKKDPSPYLTYLCYRILKRV